MGDKTINLYIKTINDYKKRNEELKKTIEADHKVYTETVLEMQRLKKEKIDLLIEIDWLKDDLRFLESKWYNKLFMLIKLKLEGNKGCIEYDE